MNHWRMRTTLMVSLLAVSLGLTAMCLLVIRISVEQEIRQGLDSDLNHSLGTYRNIAAQRNQMLARETALLADLPSLKALMATQDIRTIADGSENFWKTSGSDFFALLSPSGDLFSHSNLGPRLDDGQVAHGLQRCMADAEEACMVPFGSRLYELSIQPLFFGPPASGSRLGYAVLGYAIDQKVARQISDVAAAEVAFLIDGDISATTLPSERAAELRQQAELREQSTALSSDRSATQSTIQAATQSATRRTNLGRESYTVEAVALTAADAGHVSLVVLKSYDHASMYLHRVNRWILILGVCSLVIGLLLAASISRTVTRPLEALVAGTRALGQGDFSYRLNTDGAAEVRELALAFDRMREHLQRTQSELLESDRLATIGRMASSVSHDLRHHLSAIYANAEFMSLKNTGDEERSELLLEVQEAVQGMTDLIESLLLFSQTGQVLHVQQESISLIVERTVHAVLRHPECREVAIVVENPQPIEASVDGAKLGRALYNLVLNACQATKTGTGPPAVTIRLHEDQQQIRIVIIDSGTGVPDSIRETLFQPFISAGKVNGTGLGLTVAQHIVQEHGGEIRLDQSSSDGTVFSVQLQKKTLQELRLVASPNLAAALHKQLIIQTNIESTQENR